MPISEHEPTFRVRLTPSGLCFDAAPGESILQAALRSRVALPNSCRNGTCRACICRLTHGRVVYRIDWPGLSAEEKRDGFVLPCVAHAASDVVIEQPNARREG
ncbi:MAG TPA: 2Fe-2S iron-sulfur cluster-binding protein [Albitalea sp.]|nr:2Fe-2S iron-sulfur cluster-binding protein [Albitalea sp.]